MENNDKREMSHKEKRVRSITKLFYSRPDIQEALFNFAQNREISPRFYEGFGKRPDTFEFKGDIFEMVKKGATSFHCSEELWNDPLEIATGMSEEQMNEIRKGWDLLIDIDSKYLDYSKISAEVIINVLRFHGVKNLSVKFSVSGDTPILIREGEEISLLPISKVIELLKKGKQIEVLSLDKNKKLKFSRIYDFLEHKDTVYEITHSQSTIPLKATGYHSVFVWEKGEIVEKEVTEIKKGDFLVSYNSFENPFSQNNKYVTNTFKMGVNKNSPERTIKRKVKLNKDLMRLIGYFLAEGHVTNIINQVGFTFNKNEKEYIEDVKELLGSITNRKISVRHPNSGSTQILIHSKEWATFFDNFCGKKKNKHVPNFVWTSSKEMFLELLKGYIRGDGYKVGEYAIIAKSVSKKLITEIVWLCKLNNISSSLSSEQIEPHKLPQGNDFKGSFVYMIRIPKSEIEDIEFNRKRNKFSPYAGGKIFPIDGLKEVYKQTRPK
ncbi:MAG: LAGLIDADG family homing endonuclease, partial [Minisyncoccales bacterium]